MIRMHHVAVAALVAVGTVSANAADFFVGGSVGSSKYHTERDQYTDGGITIRVNDKSDTSFKIFGGAEILPFLGVEAGYVDLGKLKATGSASGLTVPVSIKGTGFYVDAVGQFAVTPEFGVFGKLGVFNGKAKATATANGVSASDSDSGTDATFGVGASYAFNKNLSLRAEWERFRFDLSGDKADTDLVSVGLVYKF